MPFFNESLFTSVRDAEFAYRSCISLNLVYGPDVLDEHASEIMRYQIEQLPQRILLYSPKNVCQCMI